MFCPILGDEKTAPEGAALISIFFSPNLDYCWLLRKIGVKQGLLI